MADVVLFLHQGRITEQTDKKVFFSSPTSAEAQAYMREELGAE
jgi:ABC-type histidine transport system ATPase subunit